VKTVYRKHYLYSPTYKNTNLFQGKTHIFFDLDHTLWDYNRNCESALSEIFDTYNLAKIGVPSKEHFYFHFIKINDYLWDLYDTHQITSDELRSRRFREIFDEFDIENKEICDELNEVYMQISPKKPYLIDGAMEVLTYLSSKYNLHIITNGFDAMQTKKLNASCIFHFFEHIITSEKAKARKPEIEIFEFATSITKATVNECIMIGDNEHTDIKGAQNIGMDFVFFNPENKKSEISEKSMIKHLLELKEIL
jgi:YjjG family noncanonical pyrimidine nucleotidase